MRASTKTAPSPFSTFCLRIISQPSWLGKLQPSNLMCSESHPNMTMFIQADTLLHSACLRFTYYDQKFSGLAHLKAVSPVKDWKNLLFLGGIYDNAKSVLWKALGVETVEMAGASNCLCKSLKWPSPSFPLPLHILSDRKHVLPLAIACSKNLPKTKCDIYSLFISWIQTISLFYKSAHEKNLVSHKVKL